MPVTYETEARNRLGARLVNMTRIPTVSTDVYLLGIVMPMIVSMTLIIVVSMDVATAMDVAIAMSIALPVDMRLMDIPFG